MSTTSMLATHELSKSFGQRPALEAFTIDVPAGQRVALIGHNGSGKTTLMRMVAGLLEPSSGTATINGAPAGSEAARAALSWLSDTPVFYDDLSLDEHLQYIGRLHGIAADAVPAEPLLQAVGLTERRDDLPTTFSRGLRQKAALTLALVRPFDLLLVDEPFVGLDASGKDALRTLLAEASANGATLVVATHELDFVSDVDRVVALRDGAVVYDGPPADADVRSLVLPG
jgi:ABC-2 type transport system ATP-binding protein